MSTIDIAGMGRLVHGMEEGLGSLTRHRGTLRASLSDVGLDTGATTRMDPALRWLGEELPGVRRRLALAVAIEARTPGFRPVVQIDEARLSAVPPEQAVRDGRDAAKELLDAGGEPSRRLLDRIARSADDPYFAHGFAGAGHARDWADGVLAMSRRRAALAGDPVRQRDLAAFDEKYGLYLDAVGTTLGTASRGTGELANPGCDPAEWAATITLPPTGTDGGAVPGVLPGQGAAAALLISRGLFATSFLDHVAPAVYDHERAHAGSGNEVWKPRSMLTGSPDYVGPYLPGGRSADDPMASIMTALGRNAEASQHFFTGGETVSEGEPPLAVQVNSRMKYLIQDRRWPNDDGDGLGNALESASTVYRNRADSGRRSAAIAAQAFHLMGSPDGAGEHGADWWALGLNGRPGWHLPTGMRDSAGRMLGSYMADVYRVAPSPHGDSGFGEGVWVFDGEEDALPPGIPFGARIATGDLQGLMHSVGADRDAFAHVVNAALQLDTDMLAYTLGRAKVLDPESTAKFARQDPIELAGDNFDRAASVLAVLLRDGIDGAAADEEFKAAQRAAFAGLLTSAIDVVPTPPGRVASFVFGQGKGALTGHLAKGPDATAATPLADPQDALEQRTFNALLAAGYLDRSVLGAKAPDDSLVVHDAHGRPVRFKTFAERTVEENDEYVRWYNSSAGAAKHVFATHQLPRFQQHFLGRLEEELAADRKTKRGDG